MNLGNIVKFLNKSKRQASEDLDEGNIDFIFAQLIK